MLQLSWHGEDLPTNSHKSDSDLDWDEMLHLKYVKSFKLRHTERCSAIETTIVEHAIKHRIVNSTGNCNYRMTPTQSTWHCSISVWYSFMLFGVIWLRKSTYSLVWNTSISSSVAWWGLYALNELKWPMHKPPNNDRGCMLVANYELDEDVEVS